METRRYPGVICPTNEIFYEVGTHLQKEFEIKCLNKTKTIEVLGSSITHGQTLSGTKGLHINQARIQSSLDDFEELDRERQSDVKIWQDILVSRMNCLSKKSYANISV